VAAREEQVGDAARVGHVVNGSWANLVLQLQLLFHHQCQVIPTETVTVLEITIKTPVIIISMEMWYHIVVMRGNVVVITQRGFLITL